MLVGGEESHELWHLDDLSILSGIKVSPDLENSFLTFILRSDEDLDP